MIELFLLIYFFITMLVVSYMNRKRKKKIHESEMKYVTWYMELYDGRKLSYAKKIDTWPHKPFNPIYLTKHNQKNYYSVNISHNLEYIDDFKRDPKNKHFQLVPKDLVKEFYYKGVEENENVK